MASCYLLTEKTVERSALIDSEKTADLRSRSCGLAMERKDEGFFAYPLDGGKKRIEDQTDLEETVCFRFNRTAARDPLAAREHFLIRRKNGNLVLEDLKSRNGTYLNGQRISESSVLKEGDWIFASGFSFFVFDRLLISLRKMAGMDAVPFRKIQTMKQPVQNGSISELLQDLEQAQPAAMEVESYDGPPKPEKPGWFQTLGSGFLILASSLASVCSALLKDPPDFSMLASQSVSTLSMAAAFLGYGLINRSLAVRNGRKKEASQIEQYRTYIEELRSLQEEAFEKKRHLFEEAWRKVESLTFQGWISGRQDDSGKKEQVCWKLPVGFTCWEVKGFCFPKTRYSQKTGAGYALMTELMAESFPVFRTVFLEEGKPLFFKTLDRLSQQGLVSAWLQAVWKNGQKWVWITDAGQQPAEFPFCWHPAFWNQGRFLSFPDPEAFIHEAAERIRGQSFLVCADAGLLAEAEKKEAAMEAVWRSRSMGVKATWVFYGVSEDSEPEADFSLLKSWGRVSEGQVRDSLLKMEKIHTPFLWPEKLLDREASEEDFVRCQADLKIRLSEEVWWDLQRDGPHALIAGTTGSGKSEGLLNVLSQLVLQNSPNRLKLLLIDFKGGSLCTPFSGLPHLAGTLTNLSARESVRLEKALHTELEKRQKKIAELLAENPNLNGDIDAWNQIRRSDPMPHLVIVVDEFAQLKQKCPETMKCLVETARIGRSLGVHLLLATQKPAGVIDEQIWSNSQSRLCFRVNSRQDSREVLGIPDACELSKPGEFLLSRSQNEPLLAGRSLYVRDTLEQKKAFTLENDSCLPEKQSVLERILEAAGQYDGSETGRWILHPPFTTETDFSSSALTDRISSMENWSMGKERSAVFLLEEKRIPDLLQILMTREEMPLVLVSEEAEHEDFCDVWLKPSQLWQLARQKQDWLVVLDLNHLKMTEETLRVLSASPFLHILFLGSKAGAFTRHSFLQADLKMASGPGDPESFYFLFQTSRIEEHPWPFVFAKRSGEKEGEEMVMNAASVSKKGPVFRLIEKRKAKNRSLLIPVENPLSLSLLSAFEESCHPIGFETDGLHQPVFWNGRPLVIAFESGKSGEMAENLISYWQMQDPLLAAGLFPGDEPILLLDVSSQSACRSCTEVEQELLCRDLLWIGEGLLACASLLKVKPPLQMMGNALLYEGRDPLQLELLCFSEDVFGSEMI